MLEFLSSPISRILIVALVGVVVVLISILIKIKRSDDAEAVEAVDVMCMENDEDDELIDEVDATSWPIEGRVVLVKPSKGGKDLRRFTVSRVDNRRSIAWGSYAASVEQVRVPFGRIVGPA